MIPTIYKHIWIVLTLFMPIQSNANTATYRIPPTLKCPMWTQAIIETGWTTQSEITTIDYIIWRESRCLSKSFNPKDPMGGSWGLAQINSYWCKSSKWYPDGYLQSFNILQECNELLKPRTNLLAARLIYSYSLMTNQNGWQPWNL